MDVQNGTVAEMAGKAVSFSWYDNALFGLMLGISTLIGVYFGFFDKKQASADEYLLGGKEMKVFPIAISLIASFVSGIMLLAMPADVYMYGFQLSLGCLSFVIVGVINYSIYLPVFYKIQITSVYEYLAMRFDIRVRIIASVIFVLNVLLYLPIVIYIPALAFSQATGIGVHLITPVVCSICIFYTTIGGLKAVVWTDTLQFIAMVGGTIAVLTVGIEKAGGISNIFEVSRKGERLDFDFDISPLKRDTFWAIMIGLTVNWSCISINQGFVQKFLSLPDLQHGKRAMIIFTVGIILVHITSLFIGLIMYTTYESCDPFTEGKIKQFDQLLPYYILDVAGHIPGLPGLFIAGVVCAALSTLSATLNSLSGTIYEDFVAPFLPKDIAPKTVSNILKLIVVIVGITCTALVFVIEHLGGLLSLAWSFAGVSLGPTLGVFTLGMVLPSANTKGAFYGVTGSLLIMMWIVFGAQWYKVTGVLKYDAKPLSVEGCDLFNHTISHVLNTNSTSTTAEQPFFLYRITYYYYTLIGCILVFVIGVPVSWLTKTDDPPVHRDLITPLCHRFLCEKTKRPQYYSVDNALKLVIDCNYEKGEHKMQETVS